MPLSKSEQVAEAQARANERGTPDIEAPGEPVADLAPVEVDAAAPPPAPDTPPADKVPLPREMTSNDKARADIAARFRKARDGVSEDASDDDAMRRATVADLPPEFAPPVQPPAEPEAVEPEPVAELEAEAPAPARTKHKLKVRGKEIELTDEELIAEAQKVIAADDYLAEAKRKREEAEQFLRNAKAAPAGQHAKHPGAQDSTQTADETADPSDGSEHPENPFAKTVEAIQFGDPAEAAAQLETLIDVAAQKRSKDALQDERMRNEAARSQRVLKEFQDQHPELAQDKKARAAIEQTLYDLQAEDLRKLGLDDATLPQTPAELSRWHLWYRTEGAAVRDAETLLKTARDDFLTWRGPTVEQTPAVPKAAPRVEVSVDRTARRAAIPQQPTRTVTPKPDSVVNAPPVRSRSDIVQGMIAQRNKLRGLNA